jgi:hypothetical protein
LSIYSTDAYNNLLEWMKTLSPRHMLSVIGREVLDVAAPAASQAFPIVSQATDCLLLMELEAIPASVLAMSLMGE